MNIGLGLCGALSAGIYLAYGKKGTLPALLTGATGVGLYALYEWMLSTHHISNPTQETMAQQAMVGPQPGAYVPGGEPSAPPAGPEGLVTQDWGGGNFPSRGFGIVPGNPGRIGGGGGGGGIGGGGGVGQGGGSDIQTSGDVAPPSEAGVQIGKTWGEGNFPSRGYDIDIRTPQWTQNRQNWGTGNFPSRGYMYPPPEPYCPPDGGPCIQLLDERMGWANYDPRHPDFRPISGETSTY